MRSPQQEKDLRTLLSFWFEIAESFGNGNIFRKGWRAKMLETSSEIGSLLMNHLMKDPSAGHTKRLEEFIETVKCNFARMNLRTMYLQTLVHLEQTNRAKDYFERLIAMLVHSPYEDITFMFQKLDRRGIFTPDMISHIY